MVALKSRRSVRTRCVEDFRRDCARADQSADVGEALLGLASVNQAKGDRAAAKDAAKQAVEALANGLGQSHPLTRQAVSL